MTIEQINNAINLCRFQPVEKIERLFSMYGWGQSQLEDMAKHFNCNADKHEVSEHLSMGF